MIKHSKKLITFCWSIRTEIAKYIIVGLSSFVIDFGLFYLLFTFAGLWYIFATLISQAVAIAYNFTLNRNWSFKSNGEKKKQFVRYMALQIWNYLFAAGALWIFVSQFDISPLLGKFFAIAIIVSWNFIIYKFVIYKD